MQLCNLFCISFLLLSSCAPAQDTSAVLKGLEQQLAAGRTGANEILSNQQYMRLHSQTPFRNLIKKYPASGTVAMVTHDEPGKKTVVNCRVTNASGQPLAGALVYAYQTSAKGWYADTAAHILLNEGDMRHARLFAYVITDGDGRFQLNTIRPAGYPNSNLPAHIHIAMWKNGQYVTGVPGELLFEDDERLTPERKEQALREGFIISKNEGTAEKAVYNYHFQLKQ